MNKLPPEILDDIYKDLYQKDRVEAMRVCKSWKNIIENHYLYNTIRLCNRSAIDYLIDKFQEEPQLGYQVEYLLVERFSGVYDEMNNLTTLLYLMPNLRYFYHRSWYGPHVKIHSLVQPFCKNIEHLAVQGNRSITTNLIFYNRFHRIKSLYILEKNVFDPACITKLSKLNTLTELTLDKCGITLSFSNIDFLHEHLTALESLIIFNLRMEPNILPAVITPATSLKKLHLSTIQPVHLTVGVIWLDYFSQKYPNISDLKFKHVHDRFTEQVYESGIRIDISQGYALLFSKIGYQLKRLDLQFKSLPDNFFTLLDSSGCRLEYLKLCTLNDVEAFKDIGTSKQAKSIQTLDINFDFVSNLTWLKSMTGVRTLVMTRTTKKRTPQLNALMDVCPSTLETLELCNSTLSFGARPSSHTLKSLTLNRCMFYEGLPKFISDNLRRLHTLKIHYCNHGTALELPRHSLSHFELLDSGRKKFFNVLVITSKDDKKRIYSSRYHDRNYLTEAYNNSVPSLFPPTTSSIYESQTNYDFTLKCAWVTNVVL